MKQLWGGYWVKPIWGDSGNQSAGARSGHKQIVTLSEKAWWWGGWLHKGHFREIYTLPPVPGWQWYCHKMDAYCVECLPCIYETRHAFVAYIECPCGSLVPFSKNQDAESQPEKVTWESIVRTDNSNIYLSHKLRKGTRKGNLLWEIRELHSAKSNWQSPVNII